MVCVGLCDWELYECWMSLLFWVLGSVSVVGEFRLFSGMVLVKLGMLLDLLAVARRSSCLKLLRHSLKGLMFWYFWSCEVVLSLIGFAAKKALIVFILALNWTRNEYLLGMVLFDWSENSLWMGLGVQVWVFGLGA